jgi:hypothetical protein
MSRKLKEKLSLMVVLTDAEKLAYAEQSADAHNRKCASEDNIKAYSTQAKAEIAGYEAQINMLSNKISMGKELRSVECSIHYDFDTKQKTWFRNDTGEIAKTDIISEEELQEEAKL